MLYVSLNIWIQQTSMTCLCDILHLLSIDNLMLLSEELLKCYLNKC